MEAAGLDTRTIQNIEIRLTQVELVYEQGVRNYRLLFGKPFKVITQERTYGRLTKQIALFKPGDVFALDLWDRGPYGTKGWSVFVLQAVWPGEVADPVPQVSPAASMSENYRGSPSDDSPNDFQLGSELTWKRAPQRRAESLRCAHGPPF